MGNDWLKKVGKKKRAIFYSKVLCDCPYKNFRLLDHLDGTYPNHVKSMYELNMIKFHMQMGLWITNIHENTIYIVNTAIVKLMAISVLGWSRLIIS